MKIPPKKGTFCSLLSLCPPRADGVVRTEGKLIHLGFQAQLRGMLRRWAGRVQAWRVESKFQKISSFGVAECQRPLVQDVISLFPIRNSSAMFIPSCALERWRWSLRFARFSHFRLPTASRYQEPGKASHLRDGSTQIGQTPDKR